MLKFTHTPNDKYVALGRMHMYTIFKKRIENGALRWIIDREDQRGWSQTLTTLAAAKKYAEEDDSLYPLVKAEPAPPEPTDAEVTAFMVRNARHRLKNEIFTLRKAVEELQREADRDATVSLSSAAMRANIAAGAVVETAGIIRGLKGDF